MTFLTDLEPDINIERCTHYRYRYSECSRCADQCPHDAILIDDQGVSFKSEQCTGCALCSATCPTSVFQARNLPLAKIAKPDEKTLSIACQPSNLEADIYVPCLGAIDVSILASLCTREIKVTLRGSEYCEACFHAPHGSQRFQAIIDTLNDINFVNKRAQSFLPQIDNRVSNAALDKQRLERRLFFQRLVNKNSKRMAHHIEPIDETPVSAIRYSSDFFPARRRLSEKILKHINQPITDPVTAITWNVAYIEASENGCTGCEACARVCPTGALKVSEDRKISDWMLYFSSAQCVGCGVCEEVCTTDSIKVNYRWQISDQPLNILHVLHQHRCQACGRYFIGLKEGQCPVCADDADNFSAIFG